MARRLLVLFLPLVLLAGACSKDHKQAAGVTTTSTSTSTTVLQPGTSDAPSTTQPAPTSTTTPAGDGIPMTGPVGSGRVAYSLAPERSELCYRITVKGVGKPTEAHLHRASDDSVVLGLQAPPEDGTVNTCAASDAIQIQEIESDPSAFYIDVHAPKGVLKATLR